MKTNTAIVQIICPDRPGLVSELSGWLSKHNGNILHADHHTDIGAGLFLSRIEWELDGFALCRDEIFSELTTLSNRLQGKYKLHFSTDIPQVAILASKQSHCLLDLLWRARTNEILMNVPLVISNHMDLQPLCLELNVPFFFIPTPQAQKDASERKILSLLKENRIDLVVLAKYMQVLSSDFLSQFSDVINIHHSFLPAFKGAKPYHKAWDRGVKLIGATAHYVTDELDDGPIIEQTIDPVSHRDEVDDLIRKGRDIERIALSRAVRLHLQRQVIVYRGRTAVFA